MQEQAESRTLEWGDNTDRPTEWGNGPTDHRLRH